LEPVNASESRVAEQQQHQVDVLIEFGDEVSGLTSDGALRHLPSMTMYKITGIRPARTHRRIIVQAVEASDEVYSSVVEP
jgi:hypothetical protein